MKRLFLVVPIILLMILNSCVEDPKNFSPAQWTTVAAVQTERMWTPTITATPDPNEARIVQWLNASLSADRLEATLDAIYMAEDADFASIVGNPSSLIFHVKVRCICATNNHCCNSERTFVVTINAMKDHASNIMQEVPDNTTYLQVECTNEAETMSLMNAAWSDVRGYLLGTIDGSQLGSRTFRGTPP